MLQLMAKAACCLAGVTALAAAALHMAWVIRIRRGKVLVVRTDHQFMFGVACVVPLLILTPILLLYHARFPGTWGAAALLFYHLTAVGRNIFSELAVRAYNLSEDEAVLAVRRALVLAGIEFREKKKRFIAKNGDPLAEVVFAEDRPEGEIRILPGGLPLFRLLSISCAQSTPTRGASVLRFLLPAAELALIGFGALLTAMLIRPS